jgi:hypothetical protein
MAKTPCSGRTQTLQVQPAHLSGLLAALARLAEARQASISEQTYTAYAEELSEYELCDVCTALRALGREPIGQHEPAFPRLSTVLERALKAFNERMYPPVDTYASCEQNGCVGEGGMTLPRDSLFDLSAGEAAKEREKTAATCRNSILTLAREAVRCKALSRRDRIATVDDAYLWLVEMGKEDDVLGNAAGALFLGSEWECTPMWTASQRKSNRGRMVRVWRLRP